MLKVRGTGRRVRCFLAPACERCFHPDALPALLRLGRGRGASSAQIGADLNFPRSKDLPASEAGGLEEPAGSVSLTSASQAPTARTRGVGVLALVVPPQMDPRCCVPVARSLRPLGLPTRLPGCRGWSGSRAGAPRGTARSRVHGFLPRSRPPRCAASGGRIGWRRRPEREIGMGGRGKLGASLPGSLPRLAPTRAPLASVSRAGASSDPTRRLCRCDARVPSQSQFPERWPRTGGWRVPSPPLGLGRLSVLQGFLCCQDTTQGAFPPPGAEQRPGSPANGQGLPPQDLAFQGALAQPLSSGSHLRERPLRAALSGLSPGSLLAAAPLCTTALGAELPGLCPAWLERSEAATGGASWLPAAATPSGFQPAGHAAPLPALFSACRSSLSAGPPGGCSAPTSGAQIPGKWVL